MSFSAEEKGYLRSQRLARLATVSGDGQPDVAPVGFDFDGSHFYIAGIDLPSTRKYRNVTGGNHKVALVVDDAASTTPWTPRFVRVYGTASVVRRDGKSGLGEHLQVTPTVSWSWNLDGRPFRGGEPFRPRKVIHRSPTQPRSPSATCRPALGAPSADAKAAVDAFAASLQSGHDQRDADLSNRQFAADVNWGSPYTRCGTSLHSTTTPWSPISPDSHWAPTTNPYHPAPTPASHFPRWPCTCSSAATASGGSPRGRTPRCAPAVPSPPPRETGSPHSRRRLPIRPHPLRPRRLGRFMIARIVPIGVGWMLSVTPPRSA